MRLENASVLRVSSYLSGTAYVLSHNNKGEAVVLVSKSYPLRVLNELRGVVVVMVCTDDVLIESWQQNLCNNTDDNINCRIRCRLHVIICRLVDAVHCSVTDL
jgi:hypothetical protein